MVGRAPNVLVVVNEEIRQRAREEVPAQQAATVDERAPRCADTARRGGARPRGHRRGAAATSSRRHSCCAGSSTPCWLARFRFLVGARFLARSQPLL